MRGIVSSCPGALREPGLSLLVVECRVESVCLGIFGVSEVTDAYESRNQKLQDARRPGGNFPMSP
jgi:hypothetical protein